MFNERPRDQGIVFIGHYAPGVMIKQNISAGDSVRLRVGEETVLVRDVIITAPGSFKGIVYGFEPSLSLKHEGLELEQEVYFQEQHIFGCS